MNPGSFDREGQHHRRERKRERREANQGDAREIGAAADRVRQEQLERAVVARAVHGLHAGEQRQQRQEEHERVTEREEHAPHAGEAEHVRLAQPDQDEDAAEQRVEHEAQHQPARAQHLAQVEARDGGELDEAHRRLSGLAPRSATRARASSSESAPGVPASTAPSP